MSNRQQLIESIAVAIWRGDLGADDVRRINATCGFSYDTGDDRQWVRHEGGTLSSEDLERAISLWEGWHE